MALAFPNINFIGIEKFDGVVARPINNINDNIPSNLRIIKTDAINVKDIFEKEIDTIYLNFSDPWPKKRHQNRRLTSEVFLSKYDNIFKNGKHIIMKTDNRHLFEYSIMSFTNYGYRIDDISLNMYEDDTTDNVPTEYEMKFHRLGKPIYKIEVSK
jgi:tRNA (guanine-N7-)-methyltransferase